VPEKEEDAMAIKGARPDNRQIVPYLFVRDAAQAIEFYERAFGATVLYCSAMPGGVGIFAQLRIGESVVQVADESSTRGEQSPASPHTLKGTTVVLETYVDDVDAAFARAVDAGAEPTMPPMDMFYGDRYGWVTDPFGHIWALATVIEELTPEEIDRRMGEFIAAMGPQG
jgi:PhnB protein